MTSDKTLTARDISKQYGRHTPVITSLSCTFRPGTATGLIGPNGSGKTTLLRLLAILAYPTEGHIHFGDLDVHAHPYRYLTRVGLMHEAADLPQHLSGVELLEYILRSRGKWNRGSSQQIHAWFDRVMLDERRENLIGTYSSGMLRKTQAAAALVVDPAVLLLDEPFRGLDEASTDALLELLQHHKSSGGIIVISSHLKTIVEPLCDDYIHFPVGDVDPDRESPSSP